MRAYDSHYRATIGPGVPSQHLAVALRRTPIRHGAEVLQNAGLSRRTR